MEKADLKKKIRSLFTEIGAARIDGIVHVFCFSEGKQWIAYTSTDYKLPICFYDKHFCLYFETGNPNDRTDACVQITTYASDESMNSVEDFWKGNVPYTSSKSGLVATLLTDTFRPTPELQKGFAYNVKLSDTKHFTIRGHERNIEAQYRTIQESVKNLQSLCEQSRTSITSFKNQSSSHYKDIILTVNNMDKMFGKITNSDMQKCLHQIEKVQTSAENLTRAWESGSHESGLRVALEENVTLLHKNFDSFGRPNIVKFGIDSVERHVDKLNKTVADFKNTVLVKSGFREANNWVETFNNTLQNNIVGRKINSAKGNIARVYLEEQLMVNEEMPYHCTQLLLSSPFCNVEKIHGLVTFLNQAIIEFKQMMELIPFEMNTKRQTLDSLRATYQHLLCHDKHTKEGPIMFANFNIKLEEHAVSLLVQWFNHILWVKASISIQSYTTNHLQSAITHAQVLEQFYVASDKTTVRGNVIHFQLVKDNEKMLKHDEQLYLVITLSIISLCQSEQTKSKAFISLLRFAAKHWNVRRWFGPLKWENKQQTCLKSLASFCNTTQSAIAKAEKQCDVNSELAGKLSQLNIKIAAMKTTLDETEGKFQDMFSELRITQQEAAEDIDDVSASLENKAVSDTETLPEGTLEKVNEFVKAIRDVTGTIAEIEGKIETVVQPYDGKEAKDYETTMEDLVDLLTSFRSTQKFEKKQTVNITDFITGHKKPEHFTGSTNKTLNEAKSKIASVKETLGKETRTYEASICSNALNVIKEAESILSPEYLEAAVTRLEQIVPELCVGTDALDLIELMETLKKELPEYQTEVDRILDTVAPGGECYKADISVKDLVSLNAPISQLLKDVKLKDYKTQLRSSWAKFIMPTFTRKYKQLREVALITSIDKLRKASTHFSLHLVRREWMNSSMKYIPYYCWNGDPIKEDPYYTANDTHIPCE